MESMIRDEYRVQMILDNLPVGMTQYVTDEKGTRNGTREAFRWDSRNDGKTYVNNHVRFTILYHRDPDTDLSRIVGFECVPFSVNHKYKKWSDDAPSLKTCNPRSKVSPQRRARRKRSKRARRSCTRTILCLRRAIFVGRVVGTRIC